MINLRQGLACPVDLPHEAWQKLNNTTRQSRHNRGKTADTSSTPTSGQG